MNSKVKVLFPNIEFKDWPLKTDALCLYCAESINGTPLPKVTFYNVKNDIFHIQGFFCRPCCVLGQIKETHFGAECDRSYIWTQVFLKRYFNINEFVCAPPKTALKKFGGTLNLDEFYGIYNEFEFLGSIEGPFINAYQILEFVKYEKKIEHAKENEVDMLLRPTIRYDPKAEFQETGFPPMLIDFLSQQQEQKSPFQITPGKKEGDKKEIQNQNSESLFKFMKKS